MIKFAILFGLLPYFSFNYWNHDAYFNVSDRAYYINLSVDVEHKGFFIGGYYQSTFFETEGYTFMMDSDIYQFNAGWRSKNFEIGYKHNCSHPMVGYLWVYPEVLSLREGGWDELYVKLSLEGRIK